MNLSKAARFLNRSLDPVNLDTVIFFVTSVCNAKCGTCFYWQNLNQKGDLTFEEIEKLSGSMPPFKSLLLSGGEPTLRKRLVEIVDLFVKNNGIQSVSVPINGLVPKLVREMTVGLTNLNPPLSVSIGLSIDGLGETHDEIRGVPGNFEKALASLDELIKIRDGGTGNLGVNVTSVVCSRNFAEIEALGDFFLKNYDLDQHNFVMIRGEPMIDALMLRSDGEAMAKFSRFQRDSNWAYFQRRIQKNRGAKSALGRLYDIGFGLEAQAVTQDNFSKGKAWPFPCLAGKIIGVIDWNGDVRACELRKPVANLRAYDFDFTRLWHSPEMQQEVKQIEADRCFCTHGCFLQPSQAHSPKHALIAGPLKGLREVARHWI
jgi:Fe-coproporphyrin III synthase